MSDLRDLYQETILVHNRHPRNRGALADAHRQADGHNPLCGDSLTVYLKFDGDVVSDIRFAGEGCAISTASASLMTEAVKGLTRGEVEALFDSFHAALTADGPTAELGKLRVLAGVREFPMRVKCATLAWHTLKQALEQREGAVSTE